MTPATLKWLPFARLRDRSARLVAASVVAAEDQPGTKAGEAATPTDNGAYIARGTRIFHDGKVQSPKLSGAPDGWTRIDADSFDGTYLSIVGELDPEQAARIAPGTELVLALIFEATPAVPVYIRAHFSNEEGREVLHDLIVLASGQRVVRFNLDALRIPTDLATTVWVDVVCPDPDTTELRFKEIHLSVSDL